MDEKQHTEEDETKAQIPKTPNHHTSILVGASAIGMAIVHVVNQEMAGQVLWLRMLAAAVSGGFVAGVIGFVWFTFWRKSWFKFWHTSLPVTSDGEHRTTAL